jgi:hypothetical protein
VVDQAIVGAGPAGMDRLFQRIEDEPCCSAGADLPPNNPAREGIDHEGHVDEAHPGMNAGEVGHHSALGRLTQNSRLTLSSGHGAFGLLTVVIVFFPRLTSTPSSLCPPRSPTSRIRTR